MGRIDRSRLNRAREELEGWTYEARVSAYEDLFEGPDAILSDEQLTLLDELDSALTRRDGTGLWGADEYGVVEGGPFGLEGPFVACTYHPEIPFEEYQALSESTRGTLNDALWEYCERVAEHLETELDAFLAADDPSAADDSDALDRS